MILSQKRSISCTGGSLSLYKFCIVRQTANQISGGYKSRRVPGSGSCIQEKIMNYEEARKYLADVAKYGSVPGLDNIRELMKRLGNPQDKLKFIHIAGTNGKGSVLAYLSTILTKAGYRVGRYVSPTLFSYRERIQVDGGVKASNVKRLAECGVDVFVAGSAVFDGDITENVKKIMEQLQ